MPRFLFINPPLVLEDDFIDYPYFANHGLLACAGLAARSGADVTVHDAFALPRLGTSPPRRRRMGARRPARRRSSRRCRAAGTTSWSSAVRSSSASRPPHAETRALITALRERFPRSVLLLADGYVGGQHYADYDAERVLAQYPEFDAILKYPGERFFAEPDYLASLGDARVVLQRRGGARRRSARAVLLPRRHRRRQLRSLPRALLRRRGVAEHVRHRRGDALVRHQHRLPASLHLLHQQPGWRRTGRKLYRPIPLPAPEALGVPPAHRVRRAEAHRPRRDGERPDGLRGDAPHAERARLHLRLPERHARGPSQPRGDRAHEGARRRC